ncbi:MAG: creatininase family protein [Candidatus Jordarchaeales archaeon]
MEFLLEKMTWREVEAAVGQAAGIIVPFGATEEHGPHLPISTDNIITYELACRAAEKTGFIVAPPINYGVCRSTREFPGTIALRFDTLKQLALDVISELAACGFKKIVLFSCHASNAHMTAIKEAAYDFSLQNRRTKIYFVSSADLATEEITKTLETAPYHACEAETSLMLFLKPELVQMDKAEDERPQTPPFLVSPTGKPWMRTGVLGEPTRATRKKGEIIFNAMTKKLTQILETIKNQT